MSVTSCHGSQLSCWKLQAAVSAFRSPRHKQRSKDLPSDRARRARIRMLGTAQHGVEAPGRSTLQTYKSGINVAHITAHTTTNAQGFKVRTWVGGDDRVCFALATTQGRRPDMEDAHALDLSIDDKHTALFGVFDGHAGREVAAFCSLHMREAVLAASGFQAGQLEEGLGQAFLALEQQMQQPAAQRELYCLSKGLDPRSDLSSDQQLNERLEVCQYGMKDEAGRYLGPRAGATACVALLQGDKLSVASVGDSRCVLSDNGTAVALTRDHKASDQQEARRVIKAGLSIARGRVCTDHSSLAMTRSLGDTKYKDQHLPISKQAVTAIPDTVSVPVDVRGGAAAGTPAAEQLGIADFVILACDGLWDSVTTQQAVTFLHVGLTKGLSLEAAVVALLDEALAPHSVTPATRDNVTILLVQFAPMPDAAA